MRGLDWAERRMVAWLEIRSQQGMAEPESNHRME